MVYVHPLHNLAVLQYDPKLIGDTPVGAARSTTRPRPARRWTSSDWTAAATCSRAPPTSPTIDPLLLPLSRTVQFRDSNLEVATLVNPPDDVVGVLVDKDGRVRGLWASFATDNGRELVQQSRGVPSS